RMRHAGLVELCAFPTLITLDQPEGPIWRYREDDVLSRLSSENTIAWSDAREKAARQGVLVQAHALHCAVGTKPVYGGGEDEASANLVEVAAFVRNNVGCSAHMGRFHSERRTISITVFLDSPTFRPIKR